MGAVPAALDLITMRVVGLIGESPVVSDLSFAIINPASTWTDQVNQAVTDLDNSLGVISGAGLWTTFLSSGYAIHAVQVVDVIPGTSPMGAVATFAAGTSGVAALPPNDSLAITMRTDFKGPGGRGRVYLTGLPEGSQVQGFWSGDAQDYASAIGSQLVTDFGEAAGGANMRWVLVHKSSNGGVKHAPVVPLIPPEMRPIMGFTVQNEVRSIGRRATGRRIHRTLAT